MKNPAMNDLRRPCIVFKAYHATRLSHSQLVNWSVRTGNFDRVYQLLLAYLRQNVEEVSLRQTNANQEASNVCILAGKIYKYDNILTFFNMSDPEMTKYDIC